MKAKNIILVLVTILLVAGISIAGILFLNKKDSYRNIKVYEYDGDGIVTRKSAGDIVPYSDMVLESGDNVKLNTGLMSLKLDDDKYVYVEEGTEFSIEATGSAKDSKTTINLKSGAITNDIQSKLSDESYYEINTPNSTISVRGTNYRVGIYEDENGVEYSRVSVFDGKVTTKLIFADGTTSGEELVIESGKEVIIYKDDNTTDYQGGVQDIDYSTLPEKMGDIDNPLAGTGNVNPDGEDAGDAGNAPGENVESDLTQEEIDNIALFAKYVTSTQAAAAESIEGMTLQMSDEVVMKTMGTLANDYMDSAGDVDLSPYVVPNTPGGGGMLVTKEAIDKYILDLFDYSDIVYYELGDVRLGDNGYEIWAHQGYCDTTITVNETYMDGDNYVIEGVAKLNYMDIFDPMFMDADFTFIVRRNPESPFGFTYVNLEFGTVVMD